MYINKIFNFQSVVAQCTSMGLQIVWDYDLPPIIKVPFKG